MRLSDDELFSESALRRGTGGKMRSAAALGLSLRTVNRVRAGRARRVSFEAFRAALRRVLSEHPEWFAWYQTEDGVRERLLADGLNPKHPDTVPVV